MGLAPEVSQVGVVPVQAGLQAVTQAWLVASHFMPAPQEYWLQMQLPALHTGVVPVQTLVAQGSVEAMQRLVALQT
jgi:hypothetical protein